MDMNASIVDQQVRGLVAKHAQRFEGDDDKQRSAAFVLLVIKTVLDLADDEAFECLTEGGQDAGIDGISVGDLQDGEFVVTLFQGKYKRDVEGRAAFPANAIGKILGTVGALFDADKKIALNDLLEQQVEEIRSIVRDGAIPRVRVILCNNGLKWQQDGQALIDASEFPSNQVAFEHVNHSSLVQMLQRREKVSDTLRLTGRAVVEEFNFRRVLIGKVPVDEIKSLFDRHGDRLLERNIRRYLGLHENWVNTRIQETLLTPDKRQNFYFYNNGITIICSKFRHNALQAENYQVLVEDLQIINGGQTCKTIQRTLTEHPDDHSQTFVLLRLYEIGDTEAALATDITYATNSQNPVDLRDLRANDEIQQKLELGLRDLGFEYRRKRDDSSSSGGSSVITSGVAAEAVFAVWRHKPHQAKFRRSELFGHFYDEIFRNDLHAAQVIIAVLIFRIVENERKRPSTPAPRYLPYASPVLAMLVGESLLAALNLDLAGLDHRTLEVARSTLEASGSILYQEATERLEKALSRLGITDATSLQRLAATFRRGDLLEELRQVPLL